MIGYMLILLDIYRRCIGGFWIMTYIYGRNDDYGVTNNWHDADIYDEYDDD